jgi:signal transduction histidine kinase
VEHHTQRRPVRVRSITHSLLATQLYLVVAALSRCSWSPWSPSVRRSPDGWRRLARGWSRPPIPNDGGWRRNLHDGAQQRLTALAVRLGLGARTPGASPSGACRCSEAGAEVTLAIEELRQIAHGIHPVALNLGLAAAIRSVADRSSVRSPSSTCPPNGSTTPRRPPRTTFSPKPRRMRSATQASLITVQATWAPSVLRIEILDDGIGGARETAGCGLEGLRNRVEALGGSFEVESRAGDGTRVAAVIPAAARPDDV